MLIVWLLVSAAGVAAIVWGAETFAEHLAAASSRLGVGDAALQRPGDTPGLDDGEQERGRR